MCSETFIIPYVVCKESGCIGEATFLTILLLCAHLQKHIGDKCSAKKKFSPVYLNFIAIVAVTALKIHSSLVQISLHRLGIGCSIGLTGAKKERSRKPQWMA